VPAARAESAEAFADRKRWEHDDGFLKAAPRWREKSDDAQFVLVETTRNPVFVELFDAGRDYTVRLYDGYFKYEPETPVPLDPKKSFREGYAPAACFLNWLERTYDQRLIQKLHARLQTDTYTEELFEQYTGRTADQLWAEFREPKR
jgi:hypothetical protein